MKENATNWDVFICHASEDKSSFVEPLAIELEKRGYSVWYDRFTLKLGDNLRQAIDNGLARSRYGVVILSNAFFNKQWPQRELEGLLERELNGEKVILPIWHEIDENDIKRQSPILASRFAVKSSEGISTVVDSIVDVIGKAKESKSTKQRQYFEKIELKAFAYYGIYIGDNEWTERYFNREIGNSAALPEEGDIVVATGNVNARSGYIEFTKNGWTNKPKVGIIQTGNRLRVHSMKIVSKNFIWIKFERISL